MMKSVENAGCVITHPSMGVYLGNCLGLGFWTLRDGLVRERHGLTLADRIEQRPEPGEAVAFPNEAAARAHVAAWDENNDPDAYAYVAAARPGARYATIADLIGAGLRPLLGDMAADHLRYADPRGVG